MVMNIPEAGDWIQQYYEDYFRNFMSEAEWKALKDEWDWQYGFAGKTPAERMATPLDWYAQQGVANYGISREEYEAKMRGFNAFVASKQKGGEGFAGGGVSITDDLLYEYFGADFNKWKYLLGMGGYGGTPQLDLSQFGLVAAEVTGGENIYYIASTGQRIGNYEDALAWTRSQGLVGAGGQPQVDLGSVGIVAGGVNPDGSYIYYLAETGEKLGSYDEAFNWGVAQGLLVPPGYKPPEFPAFQTPTEPLPPQMPQWAWAEEVTGIKPGERIRPGQYKIPSGQLLKRMTPSELAGLGGLVEWSAGRAPGAFASAEDYWKQAMGMLPQTQPRGTVRWATSPFR